MLFVSDVIAVAQGCSCCGLKTWWLSGTPRRSWSPLTSNGRRRRFVLVLKLNVLSGLSLPSSRPLPLLRLRSMHGSFRFCCSHWLTSSFMCALCSLQLKTPAGEGESKFVRQKCKVGPAPVLLVVAVLPRLVSRHGLAQLAVDLLHLLASLLIRLIEFACCEFALSFEP